MLNISNIASIWFLFHKPCSRSKKEKKSRGQKGVNPEAKTRNFLQARAYSMYSVAS